MHFRSKPYWLVFMACPAACAWRPAMAAPPPLSVPVSAEENADGSTGYGGFLSNLQRTNYLLGDLFGVRTLLSKYGVSLAIQETSEVLGNPVGGVRKGVAYDGLTQAILQMDTQRAFGWYGGLFNVSALQLHGRNLSSDNLANLQTASGIESDRATRLWELWYDQKLLPDDRLDIKLGQISADTEFHRNRRTAPISSTPCSVGRWCHRWICPAAALPTRYRRQRCVCAGGRSNPVAILVGVFNGAPARNTSGGRAEGQCIRHTVSAQWRHTGRSWNCNIPTRRWARWCIPAPARRLATPTSSARGSIRKNSTDQRYRQFRLFTGLTAQ